MTDISKERLVSSDGEGSPIIWPISKTKKNTKITYNNNLDK